MLEVSQRSVRRPYELFYLLFAGLWQGRAWRGARPCHSLLKFDRLPGLAVKVVKQ
ncbi:MAG: hypothetical protein KBE23_04095 [Chloroflexi bacterium]|nr:hypothetical protein [Chloroflexota bacterium]MBP7041896.1 hypothetical protein [Chloroflexota bacterium]